MIDLSQPPEVVKLCDAVRAFVAEEVIPRESRARAGHGPDEALRQELQALARERGVFAPAAGVEWGGKGLDLRSCAAVFEAAGYSPLGPLALNCMAPDEGNMHLLDVVATPEQKQRYLAPLAAGQVRSAFAMTEPAPGAGSDPAALRTSAVRDGDRWIINGRKWFITGAAGAAWYIAMVRTSPPESGRSGATMFFVDADNPGVRVERQIGSLDHSMIGGHCEVVFEDCEVSDADVLGEVGKGFEYAQVRLNPARLTHCMRWLGAACRARDVALDYVSKRELFGQPLASLGLAQQHIADMEIDIAASRALILQAAYALDTGQPGNAEVAIAKVFVSEAVFRVVDRAMQLCGAFGISEDSPLPWLLREVRPFRVYDGPSEVHRWSLARRVVRAHGRQAAAAS